MDTVTVNHIIEKVNEIMPDITQLSQEYISFTVYKANLNAGIWLLVLGLFVILSFLALAISKKYWEDCSEGEQLAMLVISVIIWASAICILCLGVPLSQYDKHLANKSPTIYTLKKIAEKSCSD